MISLLLKHISRYFIDDRYIKINGKPLLLVYNPGKMIDTQETSAIWDNYCKEIGFEGIALFGVETFGYKKAKDDGLEGLVEFPPLKGGFD